MAEDLQPLPVLESPEPLASFCKRGIGIRWSTERTDGNRTELHKESIDTHKKPNRI
jgi:hypothetical protein